MRAKSKVDIAMILAAGRGERLKPFTNYIPKAMCMVHNKPLIAYHVANLAASGFKRIIVNHAYLGGGIRHYLGNGNKWGIEICYTPEPPGALETGGGIYNALPLLGSEPFIIVNADIFTDFKFNQLTLTKLSNKAMVNLILINNVNAKKDFGLTDNGTLTRKKLFTFAGIACYHPRLFRQCKPGRYSVIPILNNLISKKLATGELHDGIWFDVGSEQGRHIMDHHNDIPHQGMFFDYNR